ncbi:MAG: molybdopterin-guanine dinucleotide biosynthesis protein B [Nitrospirae bacterium]|nr:molybdopterin-guanine dinucleotide biosynthesis protein B [Nitrospirota bacterium]
MKSVCTIGIAGYSGSGKTTLIRKILPELKGQGLAVGVLKHIHHKLNIDIRGKDTDIFYRAGADFVSAHDDHQGFARYRSGAMSLAERIRRFPSSLDLIIVEGHKDIDIPGIWLETKSSAGETGRLCYGSRSILFRDDPKYHLKALLHIRQVLERFHLRRPVMAGLLVGGKSMRMGTPKSLLKIKGRTMAARSFDMLSAVSEKTILLGSGKIPASLKTADRLADLPEVSGPLAGMLSAFRWAPQNTWLISSVDMPLMQKEAWKWLLSQRKPGVWAVMPKIKGRKGLETTGAIYEPMIFGYVESLAAEGITSLQEIAKHGKVISPAIPESLACAWSNVNTPGEWEKILWRTKKL